MRANMSDRSKLLQDVPGKLFQPSLMFAGKAGAYTSEVPFRCSTLGWAPGFTHKHQTRLERLAKDKHSSLLRKSVNYGRIFFIVEEPAILISPVKSLQLRSQGTLLYRYLTCYLIPRCSKLVCSSFLALLSQSIICNTTSKYQLYSLSTNIRLGRK